MNSDDPFFNSGDTDKTIILKPTPGRQPPTPQQPVTPPPQPDYSPVQEAVSFPAGRTASNALADESAQLIALVGRVRNLPQHGDVEGLHRQTIQHIQVFENNARSKGISPEIVLATRYALCATIDETVLNTPWGSNSLWSTQSMLSTFHQETSGGEKFFLILDRLRQQPAQNLDLLELMFTCLSLGFEGKYRIVQGGRTQLESLRDELFRIIRNYRGEPERDLSPHWAGIEVKTTLLRQVPYWVIAAFTAAFMLTIYAGFNFMLSSNAEPVIEQLENIHPEVNRTEEGQ